MREEGDARRRAVDRRCDGEGGPVQSSSTSPPSPITHHCITLHSAANTHTRSPLGTYARPLSPAALAPHPPDADPDALRRPTLARSGPEHARLSSTRATARARSVRWSRESGVGDEGEGEDEAAAARGVSVSSPREVGISRSERGSRCLVVAMSPGKALSAGKNGVVM